MKQSSRSGKKTDNLSSSVHPMMSAYTIAAGVAGVTLLAMVQPSEAEIVYTPANQNIGHNGSYNLDLNHDGITDFVLAERGVPLSFGTYQELDANAQAGNQVNCPSSFCASSFDIAAALSEGTEIGSNNHRHGWMGPNVPMAFEEFRVKSGSFYFGLEWANISNRYLGLKFEIDGETHFGWARLSVTFHGKSGGVRTWEAHLSGYAYETVANQSIMAGQTVEAENAKSSPSGPFSVPRKSLGALALGAQGLALWRREESESEGNSREG
jgi:hypothetical protein